MIDHRTEFVHGIPEELRDSAARLYDSAFGEKFAAAVPDKTRRIELLAHSFQLEFAFCAVRGRQLVGLVGYASGSGSLTGGITYRRLLSHLGFFRGHRAAIVFSLYERKAASGEMVMDGIAVDERMRGRGIGTRLLSLLQNHAAKEGFKTIRLDVIDTNPDAKRLYERNGFVVTGTQRFGYLRWLLGFGASSTMIRAVEATSDAES